MRYKQHSEEILVRTTRATGFTDSAEINSVWWNDWTDELARYIANGCTQAIVISALDKGAVLCTEDCMFQMSYKHEPELRMA